MELGILLFIQLVLYHLELSPVPEITYCSILSEDICKITLRDPFTVVLTVWAALQLTWVTMLLFVQWIQIGRGITTFEAMRGHPEHTRTSEVVTAALTAGTTTLEGAQLPHGHRHKEGCFAQWKKLLGLDTFMATAQSEIDRKSARRNPFSRGVLTNCRDFWCDPAPILNRRENGSAMLDGEIVNYTRMYESPPRMRRRGDQQALYESVNTNDMV
jgi:palmitoyltransferase ZDHHC13/17